MALLMLDVLRMLIFAPIPVAEIKILHNLNLIILVSIISTSILVFALKSDISVEGITSYNWWGGSSFIQWEKISGAAMKSFLGLGYYRIVGQDGTCVYVPRYLSRQREFELIVAAITTKKNPFRRVIEGLADG